MNSLVMLAQGVFTYEFTRVLSSVREEMIITQRKCFSVERLYSIRRLRKARRLFKRFPLFAFEMMRETYPEYEYELFWDDLRRRTPKKKRKKKSPLVRYGRYWRMDKLISQFRLTKNFELIEQANQLRRQITKPYRMVIRLKGMRKEYFFSPFISIERIEELNRKFKIDMTEQQVDAIVDEFRNSSYTNSI